MLLRNGHQLLIAGLVACCAVAATAQDLRLPLTQDSVRFVVIGDGGTGDSGQIAVAKQIAAYRTKFPFTFGILLGDNLYGSERPQDYARKFEQPYRSLIDAKVEFHAALGNHDDPNQRFYKLFNLGGERYRTFRKGNARFFVLDTNYLDPEQLKWLEKELASSGSDWKIPYFHHPLYTTATRGPTLEARAALEPLFEKYGVDVVFTGHEHVYERLHPQKGIHYFVAGGSAKLRAGDLRKSPLTAVGFDRDRSFMLVEISGDDMYFQAISRTGATVDSGVIRRREVRPSVSAPATPSAPASNPPAGRR